MTSHHSIKTAEIFVALNNFIFKFYSIFIWYRILSCACNSNSPHIIINLRRSITIACVR